MTEVEAAVDDLRRATEREAVALRQLKLAQETYRNCQDATRAAWVAVQDTKLRGGIQNRGR